MKKTKIAIRIDDFFASSKQFEVYGREFIKIFTKTIPVSFVSNFLFMKYFPGLSKRMPYEEMDADSLEKIFKIAEQNNAKLTLGLTASWVDKDGSLRPFFEKFPKQARVLKKAQQDGIIEIANHGLTHCVIGRHLPRFFSSNRKFHREFWDWISPQVHKEHLRKSQELLSGYFACQILTFVPPGNVWTKDTEKLAFDCGIRYLSSYERLSPTGGQSNGLMYIGDANVVAIHDRDIVLNGLGWFDNLIKMNCDKEIATISEIGAALVNSETKKGN